MATHNAEIADRERAADASFVLGAMIAYLVVAVVAVVAGFVCVLIWPNLLTPR